LKHTGGGDLCESDKPFPAYPGLTRNWKALPIKDSPELFRGEWPFRQGPWRTIKRNFGKIDQLEIELNWLHKSFALAVGISATLPPVGEVYTVYLQMNEIKMILFGIKNITEPQLYPSYQRG
jgi:hypothetical protein